MKVDAALESQALMEIPAAARHLEELGYDGVYTFEGPHDPFLPLLLAAEHTQHLELTTAIAIAFARTPMTLASIAYDIHQASGGRMTLGLGTQIRPHIEKRFSMPWSQPAARMREMVLAIRAIWATWHEGAPLDFRGEFYTHTLMTPFFHPGPAPGGPPRIALAGVGPVMTQVAGEVADAFIAHPFTTPGFLRSTTLPALERGFANGGRERSAFEISLPAMVATGETEAEIDAAYEGFRVRLAFYGSTPAYKVVLDAHGWGDVQPELNRLTKAGDWGAMQALITDEMLDAFVTRGRPEELPGLLAARYAGLVDRVSFNPLPGATPARWRAILDELRAR